MSEPAAKPVRLVLAGQPGSELSRAAEMALNAGASVSLAADIDGALDHLRGHGGDLAMVDVRLDIAHFIKALKAESIDTPVIACGIEVPARQAVAAIHAGARDYVPLPPDEELIAAALMSIAGDETNSGEPPKGVDALVGQSVAAVERELILRTLARCNGNRTGAAAILGISVRTMRNKLREFTAAGYAVR
ncbi:MAG: helix-turn-helix domain-containing protein [Sphingobium sp.]|jgi:DNA-binding NtrC family response regulator|nr:hypothetical protein [Sphingomonas sp.]